MVTSMQQIFGGSGWRCIHRSINEVYEINAFYAERFSFLFPIITWLQCPMKAPNVACGNWFSNHWAFTMLETDVLKYNFF